MFIKQIVSKAHYGIDLHTGAINRSNLPQIRANLDDPKTLEIAEAFGAPVVINSNVRDGSLRAYAAELGLPVLTYEAGEALRFDEISVRAGLRGIFNVMRAIGMLPRSASKKRASPVMARSTSWVRAPASGIVSGSVRLGSRVTSGEQLAIIGDPLGGAETRVIAPFDGIVIGRSNLPLAHEGDALVHLGAFKSTPKAETVVGEFTAAHSDEPELT